MRWEEGATEVWREASGAGYEQAEEPHLRADPVMRLMLRDRRFEEGRFTAHTAEGVPVEMDAGESKVLLGRGRDADAQAKQARVVCAQAGRVAAGLHMEHHFTDAWATDGSKAEIWHNGEKQTRVACGAFCGVMPTEPAWHGEPAEEGVRRGLGLGMYGQRLPANYEIVDAELHGILLALRETARNADAAQRRCLIMSDTA